MKGLLSFLIFIIILLKKSLFFFKLFTLTRGYQRKNIIINGFAFPITYEFITLNFDRTLHFLKKNAIFVNYFLFL